MISSPQHSLTQRPPLSSQPKQQLTSYSGLRNRIANGTTPIQFGDSDEFQPKNTNFPYVISFYSPNKSDEHIDQLMESFYQDCKISLLKAFKRFKLENPAVEFDDKKRIIKLGYGKTELKILGFTQGTYKPVSAFEAEQQRLTQKANKYFETLQLLPREQSHKMRRLAGKQPKDVIQRLLKKYPGFILGEAHASIASKKFLIENMKTLKKNGVNTLFMEHLCSDLHQEALESYAQAPPEAELPERLKFYLKAQDKNQMLFKPEGYDMSPHQYLELRKKYNFTEVVKAAKQAGITVIPIDNEASYSVNMKGIGEQKSAVTRYKVMNYLASKRIKHHPANGKWIAFVGSGHATACDNVPGLAQLLDVPSVIVDDKLETNKTGVQTQVRNYFNAIQPDVVITLDATQASTSARSNSFASKIAGLKRFTGFS